MQNRVSNLGIASTHLLVVNISTKNKHLCQKRSGKTQYIYTKALFQINIKYKYKNWSIKKFNGDLKWCKCSIVRWWRLWWEGQKDNKNEKIQMKKKCRWVISWFEEKLYCGCEAMKTKTKASNLKKKSIIRKRQKWWYFTK